MTISSEERQRRIDLLEKENEAIKNLNDLSGIKSRVEKDKSLIDQAGIIEDESQNPMKKIANSENESSI
jgi:hypothetical protein